MVENNKGQVIFIGAGPGDPELLTLKGKRILETADRVIYAGSLVNPEILNYCRDGIPLYDSAGLTLEDTLRLMVEGVEQGETVVRLHTGDPSVYGAIQEQMEPLEERGITYSVIPGVSSVFAAAASVKKEFTLPEVSQTVILTRLAGRTPVPERESLSELAKHQASMAIFLSVQDMGRVVQELLMGYEPETPVAVVYRASWEDEQKVFGTLATIEEKVKQAGIRKQAQILVGDFLNPHEGLRSKLYDPEFTHEYRMGQKV